MKKKMYVTPVVELVSLAAERQLLAGSGVTVTNTNSQNMGSQTWGGGTTTPSTPSNPYSSSAGQQSGSQSAGAKFSGGITWFGE